MLPVGVEPTTFRLILRTLRGARRGQGMGGVGARRTQGQRGGRNTRERRSIPHLANDLPFMLSSRSSRTFLALASHYVFEENSSATNLLSGTLNSFFNCSAAFKSPRSTHCNEKTYSQENVVDISVVQTVYELIIIQRKTKNDFLSVIPTL